MPRLYSLILKIVGIPFAAVLISGCTPRNDRSTGSNVIPQGSLSFTEVTAEAGLAEFQHINGAVGDIWFPETMGAGGGFVDFDNDGWLDIILVGGGEWSRERDARVEKLWLYRNNTDGTFEHRPSKALSRLDGYGFGVVAADYDNDGDEDIYFTTLGPNHLLRNDDGVFVDATAEAGLAGESAWSSSALFFDADRDGWIDLYVGNYVEWTPGEDLFCSTSGDEKGYCTPELYQGRAGRFYRNQGDGTFADRTEASGFTTTRGKTLGVTDLDFNQDGWPDLAVANDTDPDFLYRNNGDGTFEEIGLISGMAFDERGRARAGMGIDAGVTDATGEESIFVGNFSNQTIGVYRHIGNSLFVDRAASSKIGRTSLLTLTFGLFLFDVDLDGDLDLYAANGHVQPTIETTTDNVQYRESPHLFENAGDGTFVDAVPKLGAPLSNPLVGRGAAYGDFDNDGDLDILVTENGGPVHLLRNDLTTTAGRLRVNVEGVASNRNGIDAKVVVVVGGRRLVRRVRTGASFLSNSEKTVTFGLPGSEHVDSLIVYWPSGTIDRYGSIGVGRTANIVEGSQEIDFTTRSR